VLPLSSCRTRAAHQADRRSDPRTSRTCAGRDATVPRWYLCRHHRVNTKHLFKVAFLLCAHRAEPPHHCHAACHGRRHCRALVPRRSSHPITRAPSIGPLGAPSVSCCPTRVLHSPESWPPRPSPPATAMRRRRVSFRPNSEYQRALGEHALLPAPLHDRERRRPHRIWPGRAAPMAMGHNASPQIFLGSFL
jgi:hypothetical protein